MAKFTLPANWQEDFFEVIDFTDVVEVYGKMREDFIGGGKSSMAQAQPSKILVRDTVREVHKRGMSFNYLLNSTCIGNLEYTSKGYKEIRKLLDWLASIEVDSVSVALPFIAQIIKKLYPQLKINVSTQADVDSLEKAKQWEELGVDVITLSHVGMNKNFSEIKRISDHCKCDTQLIANMTCKRGCAFVTLHGNLNAHASHSWSKTNRYNMDYYFVNCLACAMSDPLSVIKSNWIRPEDVLKYEELGIKRFKLAERGLTSSSLSKIIDGYRGGSYDGNLMDLIPSMSKYVFIEKQRFSKTVKELMRTSFVKVFKMREAINSLAELKKSESYFYSSGLYVDNKKLEGAMAFFMKKDCMHSTCDGCNYCEELVKASVTVLGGETQLKDDTDKFKVIIEKLIEGYYF
jgi:collagenase-like PrtC family protease